MNHLKKKSLLGKYIPVAKAGASPVEVKNAITEEQPGISMEDVDKVVLEVFASLEDPETEKEKVPAKETPPAAAAAVDEVPHHPMTVGKARYDIWYGQWHPTGSVTNPMDGKTIVLNWEFRPEGKPRVTSIPCEPRRAEEFNAGKRLRVARVFTEQMIPCDQEDKRMYDKIDNPFEVKTINS